MFRLMRKSGGAGLAAPQVGIDARFFVTEWREMFNNPVIGCDLGLVPRNSSSFAGLLETVENKPFARRSRPAS